MSNDNCPISLDLSLGAYLAEHCYSDSSDPIEVLKAWIKFLEDYSKNLLSLAKAIKLENSNGAEIEIHIYSEGSDTFINFWGETDALKRLTVNELIDGNDF